MSAHDLRADIMAVRAALERLCDDEDELLGIGSVSFDQEEIENLRRDHLPVCRILMAELIDFLDAREDIVDLQVRNGLDPLGLLLRDELDS